MLTHFALQAVGIRYIGFRNEQAAGYAAAASGFLTGVPGVLLTVSGPGAVHGIAGLSHAQVNTWPMILLSGSAEQVVGFWLPAQVLHCHAKIAKPIYLSRLTFCICQMPRDTLPALCVLALLQANKVRA